MKLSEVNTRQHDLMSGSHHWRMKANYYMCTRSIGLRDAWNRCTPRTIDHCRRERCVTVGELPGDRLQPADAQSDREKANMKVEITIGGKTPCHAGGQCRSQGFREPVAPHRDARRLCRHGKDQHPAAQASTQGTPDGYHPRAGDIAYYAPWGNVAIFYKDGRAYRGSSKLGTLDTGLDALTRNPSMKATIAAVP